MTTVITVWKYNINNDIRKTKDFFGKKGTD